MIVGLLCLTPGQALAPELKESLPVSGPVQQISRGEPVLTIERRVMRVTAYTANDKGMNGRGITANGERAQEGRTIAAPKEIPLGSEIFIPDLGKTFVVTDRGGAIYNDRLDLFMEKRKDAMDFGVQYLEVWVRFP